MKVSIDKDTGLMIESQSHADDETLIRNAQAYGFANVEIRIVSAEEHAALIIERNINKRQ